MFLYFLTFTYTFLLFTFLFILQPYFFLTYTMLVCGDQLCCHQALPLDGRQAWAPACALCEVELHDFCGVFYQEDTASSINIFATNHLPAPEHDDAKKTLGPSPNLKLKCSPRIAALKHKVDYIECQCNLGLF